VRRWWATGEQTFTGVSESRVTETTTTTSERKKMLLSFIAFGIEFAGVSLILCVCTR
jgi:hypothetical protein